MRTVKAVEEYAKRERMDTMSAATELQDKFKLCKRSLANFVIWAQCHGLLTKRASRGKTTSGTGGQ